MYFGAEHLIGFLTVCPSAQWYSYFGPADIMEHRSSVQNSVMVPYSMLIWLKKSTVLTAIHSFRSSPSGSWTACLKFPEVIKRWRKSRHVRSKIDLPDPRVAAACFIKSCWCEPSGMFFLGLKVFEDLLPLKPKLKKHIAFTFSPSWKGTYKLNGMKLMSVLSFGAFRTRIWLNIGLERLDLSLFLTVSQITLPETAKWQRFFSDTITLSAFLSGNLDDFVTDFN